MKFNQAIHRSMRELFIIIRAGKRRGPTCPDYGLGGLGMFVEVSFGWASTTGWCRLGVVGTRGGVHWV